MENFEPINLVQQCRISDTDYDLLKFNRLLAALSPSQFNQFCLAIMSLTESHDTNQGAICTDQEENIIDKEQSWIMK